MSRLLPRLRPRLTVAPLSTIRFSSSFRVGPAPPKLPADQQAEFERLQRAAAVSSAFQPEEPIPTSTSPLSTQQGPRHTSTPTTETKKTAADNDDNVNQGLFRGAPPEFEGDVNPKTGEVGGPKNEPLRWGDKGDWSYNGRVTDF